VPAPDVAIERHDGITVVRMQRAPANAINLEFAQTIEAAYDEAIASDPAALVLTGTGTVFSAGLDLKAVPLYSPEQQRDLLRALNRMLAKLYACPIPVIGAINGHAIAGGFILVLTTDYRVGPATGALFGLTEARVGIPFPAGPMIVLQAELPPQHVRYTTLYPTNYGPDEAKARGILDELQPAERVLERALEVARDMSTIPADAYRRIKQQFRANAIAQLEKINAEDSDPMLRDWVRGDAAAASAAVLEKRARG